MGAGNLYYFQPKTSIITERMAKKLAHILSRISYLTIALISGVLIYLGLVVVSNIDLFQHTLFRSDFSLRLKLDILKSAIVNLPETSAITTLFLALLLGLNIAVITFYFRNKVSSFKAHSSAASVMGALVGILGLGCAACGSFIIMTLIPFLGLGTLFAVLPFHGKEFGILGIILLLISLYLTLKEIAHPPVCEVE